MNVNLDGKFLQWLNKIGDKQGLTLDEVADRLARNEIEDREKYFPQFNHIFSQSKYDINLFSELAKQSWPLGQRFDIIRLSGFLNNPKISEKIIKKLLVNFPESDREAIIRINEFIEDTVVNGYVNEKNRPDRAGAGLLASVILTSVFPERFVDFRTNRWEKFYKIFNDDELESKNDTHGSKIVGASNLAQELAKTKTFQKYWPDEQPLWVISSFAWVGPNPNLDEISEEIEDDSKKSYSEGKLRERLHKFRERDSRVTRRAKALRIKKDPLLKCDGCGFSFFNQYGSLGKNFIEAHHTIPIESLLPGDKTKIEDIALVCSNCHSMIHRSETKLSISELRILLRQNQKIYQNK